MKKISIILLTLLTLIKAEEIVVSYEFEHPELKKGSVEISGTMTSVEPYAPAIPVKPITILLPTGHQAVSYDIILGKSENIITNVEILPALPSGRLSIDAPVDYLNKRSIVYSQDKFFPESPKATSFRTQFKNGHPLFVSTVYPLQYNPVTKIAKYYKDIQVIVHTQPVRNNIHVKTDPLVKKALKSIVDNPKAVDMLQTQIKKSGDYDYLIITKEEFKDGFSEFTLFNKRRGLKSKIITVEDISSNSSGSDLQEKIRNCIKKEYTDHNITYALLGGDDEYIPHRGFRSQILDYGTDPYDEKDIPADIYYSCLDGSWKKPGSNYYGEPGSEDFYYEVYTARFCIDSQTELANIINKTIKYAESPVASSIRNNMLVGEFLWSANDPSHQGFVNTWGKDYMEEFLGTCNHSGYTTIGFENDWSTTNLFDHPQTNSYLGWKKSELINKIKNNKISWIDHLGHSNVTYNMKLSNYNINSSNFPNDGENANYFFIYSQGCYSGSFDNTSPNGVLPSDCIGEVFTTVKGAAFAYIGNSRYGLGSPYDTDGSGQRFARFFHHASFSEKINKLEKMNAYSKEKIAPIMLGEHDSLSDSLNQGPYFGQLHWIAYCVNLLGDPAVSMWTAQPQELSVSISNGLDKINKKTNIETEPYTNIAICTSEEQILTTAITNESGNWELSLESEDIKTYIDNNPEGSLKLYLKADNYLSKEYEIDYTTLAINDNIEKEILLSNYPNPFNPTTTISYQLNRTENVKLSIYNSHGELVTTLQNGVQSKGKYNVTFDGKNLSSGVYTYKITVGGTHHLKRMLLLK